MLVLQAFTFPSRAAPLGSYIQTTNRLVTKMGKESVIQHKTGYEEVGSEDPELNSDCGDEERVTLPKWPHGFQRRKPRTLLSKLWLCTRLVLITASVVAWLASLWLVHLTSRELGRARSLFPNTNNSSRPIYTAENPIHPPQIPTTSFIPGGTLPVPGYGFAYNTSYCDGWTDPEGAKARGCVLDPSQGGWVHELCHDPALRAEWMALPDFGWYLDPKRKRRISQDRVWAADIPGGVYTSLYTAMDFHVQHCRFVMKLRVKNGMRRDRGLGYLPLDPAHMYHCVDLMAEFGASTTKASQLTKVNLGNFGGGTEGFGLAGECYVPMS